MWPPVKSRYYNRDVYAVLLSCTPIGPNYWLVVAWSQAHPSWWEWRKPDKTESQMTKWVYVLVSPLNVTNSFPAQVISWRPKFPPNGNRNLTDEIHCSSTHLSYESNAMQSCPVAAWASDATVISPVLVIRNSHQFANHLNSPIRTPIRSELFRPAN